MPMCTHKLCAPLCIRIHFGSRFTRISISAGVSCRNSLVVLFPDVDEETYFAPAPKHQQNGNNIPTFNFKREPYYPDWHYLQPATLRCMVAERCSQRSSKTSPIDDDRRSASRTIHAVPGGIPATPGGAARRECRAEGPRSAAPGRPDEPDEPAQRGPQIC